MDQFLKIDEIINIKGKERKILPSKITKKCIYILTK